MNLKMKNQKEVITRVFVNIVYYWVLWTIKIFFLLLSFSNFNNPFYLISLVPL